jgi:hypothetical protein
MNATTEAVLAMIARSAAVAGTVTAQVKQR